MPIIKGQEGTFDTVAQAYEKLRPGYVTELYEALFDYIHVDYSSRAVEVGIGGGQATEPVLMTGCELTAVEYGEHFSALCTEKFKHYPKFSVINGRFEETELKEGVFDLVYSASAFHWIPEDIGYSKVFSILKRGGAFARFACHPYRDKGNPALSDAIDRVYAMHYYKYYGWKPQKLVEYGCEDAERKANIASGYGFTDIQYKLFYRTRTYSAKQYSALLGTYSDHIAIEDHARNVFFEAIEQAIDDNGGHITLYDTIDLELARKP